MAALESEMKFASKANTQLKFTPLDSGKDLFRKLRTLCTLLDIGIEPAIEEKIEDEYYDDGDATLLRAKCLLRRRAKEGTRLVTLKIPSSGPELSGGLNRIEDEFEYSDDDFLRLIRNSAALLRRIRDLGFPLDTLGPLSRQVVIKNDRLSANLTTGAGEYNLSHDSFYYFADCGYSENFSEIEVEKIGDPIQADVKIEKLRRALTELLGYAPSSASKVKRGMAWIRNRGKDLRTVYSVGFDIVGFSKETAETQKQLIQTLNHAVKKAISSIRGPESVIVYLPTGDGMILVFEDRPDLIVSVVREVQQSIRRHNDRSPLLRVLFRTGLHSGPVFRYSDVNGYPNFAGNGINLVQRVMAVGEAWHVLASREAFECMGNIDSDTKLMFHSLRVHNAKHGVPITIYNVSDEAMNFGNPTTPPKV